MKIREKDETDEEIAQNQMALRSGHRLLARGRAGRVLQLQFQHGIELEQRRDHG
jgi:hypothetical protein